VASIDNLPQSTNSLGTISYTVIRDGLFNLRGKAQDPISTDALSYQLLLFLPGAYATPVANVTPSSRDAAGFHPGGDITNSLGTIDLSAVENGTYDLKLIVHGGGAQATAMARFILNSQLKIGQFSFSEQDLVLPVNGIPLTVTRTYNSLNPRSADFGYSWSYFLNSMDVSLDEQRGDFTIGVDPRAPVADVEEDENGLALRQSIRTGGGRDVTLTLPDGRRTTFQFYFGQRCPCSAVDDATCCYPALWQAPAGVNCTLTASGNPVYNALTGYWNNEDNTGFETYDFAGFVLTAPDGTQYCITRGTPNNVIYDTTGNGNYINVRAYGPPALSKIVQRSGDSITIGSGGILHYAAGPNGTTTTNLTRSVFFDRDSQGRITAIRDPNSGSSGLPVLKYIYNQDTGNLIQVHRLTDRAAGTFLVAKYHYDNAAFPHYITSIENPLGVPVARNEYDDSGRLTAVVDADGNRTEFHHNTTNDVEVVIDRLGHTNTYAYDPRGNVTAMTNALNGITRMAYDDNNNKTNEVAFLNGQPYATNSYVYDPNSFLLVSVNPLGYSNVFSYNNFGQVLTSTDARGNTSTNYYDSQTGNLLGTSDALGNSTTNFYDPNGTSLLFGSRDATGTLTTNYYDPSGNLTATATRAASGILTTNSFTYDANGNRTNSTVWRKVNNAWTPAVTAYIFDAMNRVVQTIDPDGGTNTVVYNAIGKQQATIDKLGRQTSYTYDDQGRLAQTAYPDGTSEFSYCDAAGNRTNSVDRAGRATTYVFDALNRPQQTIFPDNTTNLTLYDGLGRVQFSVDARGVTNAFGYDAAGRRTAVTNALGTVVQMINGFAYDANGNQIAFTDALGRTTTSVFDALNRVVQVSYADGTKTATGYDSVGRRVAETNQDLIITLFGYDGAGRLVAVTNAFGITGQQTVTRYQYDEAGNQTAQIDALSRTTSFACDSMGRRIKRTLPGSQAETMAYDLAGNLIRATNFNSVVITNQYDWLNRLTNRSAANGYRLAFAYSPTGQRTNMSDSSGTTAYLYDNRDRLANKVVSWSGGPMVSLNYAYDAAGNVTNLWSSTSGGVNLQYAYDPLNRITNVLANGSTAAAYGFDLDGNLQSVRYGNGATNLCQYDLLNRLTNSVWKSNQLTLASFYYQLGATGSRTNLTETLFTSVTNRSCAWSYDSLYRLTSESISGIGSTTYGLDRVGNRTNRTAGLDSLPAQSFAYGTNDWLVTDGYDSSGNTLWSTNGGTATGPYYYDVENRLTNFNNSVFLAYNGDGIRMRKTASGTNFFYLVDDRNPTGYAQVLEEWTASGGTTNLNRVYNYGLALVSQQQGSTLYYFVPDGHGSTRLLVDGAGAVANAFTYDAYGNLIASNAPPQTWFLYCGEQFDSDLGTYYLRARYYQPNTGRFWTMDSYDGNQEDPLSLHKYLYVADNPVNMVDPTGHDFDLDFFLGSFLDSFSIGGLGARIEMLAEEATGNRTAGIVFNETSLIFPQLIAGKSPGGIANWDTKSRSSLNSAREKIAEIANAGKKRMAQPKIPNPTTPVQKAQWQDCVDAANKAQGKTSDDSVFLWPSDGGKTPSTNPKHNGDSWPYDYKPYDAFGPFRKIGADGDVPQGNNIYIYFYKGVP
jgi:RHS repeat-associated protein